MEASIYQVGNPWQKKVYRHMSHYFEECGVENFGSTRNGNQYKHWLTVEDAHFNFVHPEIHEATLQRFKHHKAGDLNRILINGAASQPYCFNLFIYLKQHLELANLLFGKLLGKQVQVQHIEPEFTPNTFDVKGFEKVKDESIGDQNKYLGTDADVAIFYTYGINQKGLLLAEFKFIEAEFSVCSSYADKLQIQSLCSSINFYTELVQSKRKDNNSKFLCGYNKYSNWNLTEKSKVLDITKIKSSPACPFRFGLNQLWRNMLLAEQIASARQCEEFAFWVFSPVENDNYLWRNGDTEAQFKETLTEQGKQSFRKIYLNDIHLQLQQIVTDDLDKTWLGKLDRKYLIV